MKSSRHAERKIESSESHEVKCVDGELLLLPTLKASLNLLELIETSRPAADRCVCVCITVLREQHR